MSLFDYSISNHLFYFQSFVLISYYLLSATNIHILLYCAKLLLFLFKNVAALSAIPYGCDIDRLIFYKVIDSIV